MGKKSQTKKRRAQKRNRDPYKIQKKLKKREERLQRKLLKSPEKTVIKEIVT